MKQKLFNVLKPLVASKGLSKEEIESLADIYAKNLTETSTDEDVNNVANSILPVVDMMQKMGNRMATSVENKYKGWVDPKTIQQPPTEPPVTQSVGLTAEDVTKMVNEQAAKLVEDALKPYKEREEQTRLRNLLYSHDKVKNVPETFRSRFALDSEENLEAVASQIENDYTSLKQDLLKSGQFTEAPAASSEQAEEDALISQLKAINANT